MTSNDPSFFMINCRSNTSRKANFSKLRTKLSSLFRKAEATNTNSEELREISSRTNPSPKAPETFKSASLLMSLIQPIGR